jgi:hypothetical protein
MTTLRRLLARSSLMWLAALLQVSGCTAPRSDWDDDNWRPFQSGSRVYSSGSLLERQRLPAGYGSSLTVPRVTGGAPALPPMGEEEGNVWPDPETPRTTLTDPNAVARGIPNFRSQASPLQAPSHEGSVWDGTARNTMRAPAPGKGEASPQVGRPGDVIRGPDGRPAVQGAGTEGAGTYTVPGRPGVGTSLPDGRGGRILVEPNGGTVIVPR